MHIDPCDKSPSLNSCFIIGYPPYVIKAIWLAMAESQKSEQCSVVKGILSRSENH